MTFPEHKGICKTSVQNFKTSLSQPIMTDLETKAKECFEKESVQYEALHWDTLSVETKQYYKRRARHLDLIVRLRKRAEIRRSIPRGEPDRIADLLEEAANAIEGNDDEGN